MTINSLGVPSGVNFGDESLTKYDTGSWTPVLTASSGTLTTSTASGFYTRIGDVVHLFIDAEISNVGTGTGAILLTTPFTSNINAIGSARERQSTGVMGQAYMSAFGSNIAVLKYDATTIMPPSAGFTYRYNIQVTIKI